MEPLVSIGIATRNRPDFLKEAVESALSQDTDSLYEVIVVDDASTDPDVRGYLDSIKDPRLRVVYKTTRGGEAASRNTIIQNMNGEFSLWLDDDDCLTKDAVSSQLAALARHPDADVVYANLLRTDSKLAPVKEYIYKEVPRDLQLYVLLFYSPFPNGGSLIRKSLFEQCGFYDENFTVAPDYEFWVRAVLHGAKFVHNDRVIYLYRAHGNNAALDNEDETFCRMNVRVVQRLVSNMALEGLFPMYNWEKNREQALGLAMASIGVIFARYRHYDLALDTIRQGEERSRSFELRAMKATILRMAGKTEEACEVFEDAVIGLSQPLFGLMRMAGLR